jgi:hypothetical protein
MDKEIFKNHTDYWLVADNIRDIYLSEGSLLTLLDFERVLDEMDLYAFRNWQIGELVQGPDVRRYSVACVFMWPYKLMPNPKGARRLVAIGCKVKFAKSEVKVPVEVVDYDDYIPGTRYPKSKSKKVWFVYIEIPKSLLDDIKEGTIDLAGQEIDLEQLDDSYDDDLDKNQTEEQQAQNTGMDMAAPAVPPAPAA